MTADIVRLEDAFNGQLPEFRAKGRPSDALLSAADQWSRAVWAAAEEKGPHTLRSTAVSRGLWLAERPVFICGVHRSGTTLVRNLLDGHPQLSVLPSEGSFLTGFIAKLNALPATERLRVLGCEWLRRLANPTNQAPYWLLGRTTHESSPHVTFARYLLAWWPIVERHFGSTRSLPPLIAVALAYTSCFEGWNRATRIQRWAEKTPTNEFHLDRLWAELPGAKVIHVVRDPLDVYASRKRLEENSVGSFRSARRVLEDLARSLEIAARYQARSDRAEYHLVRYEELVDEPERITAGLADFLGIEAGSSLLHPTVANLPAYTNSAFGRPQESGSILADAPGRHRDSLAASEQELVAAFAGDAAAVLGYPTRRLTMARTTLLKMKLRYRHLATACFRYAGLWRRRGK